MGTSPGSRRAVVGLLGWKRAAIYSNRRTHRMPAFRKALLLFNPVSGGQLERRTGVVGRIADTFRNAGVEVQVEATHSKGSAGEQARAAVREGCDAVLACGGDGTVFDVLQGVAETPAMMGVIPLGTGNVLAHDLGLAARPERAAAQLLNFTPQTISLGRIQSAGCSRRPRWSWLRCGCAPLAVRCATGVRAAHCCHRSCAWCCCAMPAVRTSCATRCRPSPDLPPTKASTRRM